MKPAADIIWRIRGTKQGKVVILRIAARSRIEALNKSRGKVATVRFCEPITQPHCV